MERFDFTSSNRIALPSLIDMDRRLRRLEAVLQLSGNADTSSS
jgi:hypothetical protein